MSGQEHKKNWSVDWWVGIRVLPLIEHSVKDEEEIIGQQQCPGKLSWGAGIWAALWLLWLAVSAGIYPNVPVEECSPTQIKKKDQTKKLETEVAGVAGSQAPNDTSRKAKRGKSGRMRAKSQYTESEDSEDSD